jgi:AcrR family transcriptional regulator
VNSPQRRTQTERSTETRELLQDATIDCLVEFGYAGTTTRLVAERAGVSRGAQTHHFPAKTELVAAAIEHLFDQQARNYRQALSSLPEEDRTLDQAIALLWDIVNGPSYAAVLELTVAGRTDPELRVVVHAMSAVLETTVVELLREFFPAFGDEQVARTIIDVAFTFVQGAAVSTYAGYGDPERTIRLLRNLAGALSPAVIDFVKGALSVLDT